MTMKDHQYFYSEKSNGFSTSHLQIGVDKVTASVKVKCPICQEHHDILGLTEAFELHIKYDILFLKNKSARQDVFKIKYCPFCGRPLNEEDSDGESIDKSPTSGD